MRRKLWITVMLTALTVGLAGCGVRETQKDTAEKNKADAVIQNAGTSEEQQLAVLKERYEEHYLPRVIMTERCLYCEDEEDDDEVIILQMDHAGNELSRTPVEDGETFDTLLCGSDKCLIYARYTSFDEDNDNEDLYRVPIVQTDDGEVVQWEQEKKIATLVCESTDICDVYLQDPYLIYSSDQDHTLVRLDMETGEEKTLDLKGSLRIENCLHIDGCLYPIVGDSETLYRLPVDSWTPEKLYEHKLPEEIIYHIWINGQFVYMDIGRDEDGYVSDRLECFDMEQKKTVGQLPVQDTIRFLKEEKICTDIDEWDVSYEGLTVYGGKVYITVGAVDGQLDDECNDGNRLVSLSCSENTMSDLANEPEMTDWYYEHRSFNMLEVQDGYEDFYYIECRKKEDDVSSFMRYHLDTKKLEAVGQDELINLVDRLASGM